MGDGGLCVPTSPSTEVCDGIDNDCNGAADGTPNSGAQICNITGLAAAANGTVYFAETCRIRKDAIALGQQARTHALLANGGWGLAGAVGVAAVVTYFVQN